jgi:hypothetical protein
MSLGKLLTTGKSLVGLRDCNSRYQLRKGALPKFGSAQNPFISRVRREPPVTIVEREPQLPKLTAAEVAAANLKKTQALPVMDEPAVAKIQKPQPAELTKVPGTLAGWLKKMNPMLWWANRKPAQPKPLIPRFSQTHGPVQGELSLDNIKVLRNDLSETDMEVVQAKARPVAPRASGDAVAAVMPAPEIPSAKKALDYLNDRLLGKH